MASTYNNVYIHAFYTVSGNILTTQMYNNTGNLVSSSSADWGANIITALTTLDNNGTNPYTLGMVDLSSNKVQMDVAFSSYYNTALTNTQQSAIMTYITQTYKEPRTNATQIYTVTVSGGVYWISGVAQPFLTFTSGNLYVFDQSHVSNTGNTLVLGTGADTGIVGNNVVYNGTAGSLNAYTLIDFSGANAAPLGLYYFSSTTTRMGSIPIQAWYPDESGLSSTTIKKLLIRQSANLSPATVPNFATNFPNLETVTFETGRTFLPDQLFINCHKLISIEVPNSVTSIGNECFVWCDALTSVTLSTQLTSIGSQAFTNCRILPSLYIPPLVSTLQSYTFVNCYKLTTITMKSSLRTATAANDGNVYYSINIPTFILY